MPAKVPQHVTAQVFRPFALSAQKAISSLEAACMKLHEGRLSLCGLCFQEALLAQEKSLAEAGSSRRVLGGMV